MEADALTWTLAVIRGVHLATASGAFGALAFDSLILRSAVKASLRRDAISAQCRRLALFWLVFAVLTGAAWLVLLAAQIAGSTEPVLPPRETLLPLIFDTRFGGIALIRLILALFLAVALLNAKLQRLPAIAFVLALAFLVAIAWTGHAGSGEGEYADAHLFADAVHAASAAIWVGGLLPLMLVLLRSRRTRDAADAAIAPGIVLRFSDIALPCVVLLLGSGLVNAWMLVGDPRLLLVTEHGRALLVKAGLFAAMLMLAALNRFIVAPQLLRPRADHASARMALARSAALELVLGLCIYLVVGAMGQMHPAIHFLEQLLAPT